MMDVMNECQRVALKDAENALTFKGEEVKACHVNDLGSCNDVMACITIGSEDDEDSILRIFRRTYLFYIDERGGFYYITDEFKKRYIKKHQIHKHCCISDY